MRSTGRRRIDSSPSSVHAPPGLAGEPAGQQPHQRAGVADVDRRRPARAPRAGPGRGSRARRRAARRARRAPARPRASSACRRRRGSRVIRTGSAVIAPSSAARWEIDLSGGARERRRAARAAGSKRTFMRAPPRSPSPAISSSARRPRRARRRSTARSMPLALSGGGVERHVDDVDAARGRARARSRRRRPGRFGTEHAQLVHLAAGEVGLEQPPAVLARGVVPRARSPSSSPAGERVAHRRQPRDRVVDRRHQRVGVGEVDVAPDRGVARRPRASRRGSSGRSPAAARPRRTAPARPGRRARWRARAAGARRRPSARSCVSASIAAGRAPSSREQPVQALVERRRSVRAVGVRYQVAPSNRSARACSTPAVSAPASGWPPMKRGSSTAATSARLVEPTSVTTQSAPARRQRLARPRPAARRTGAATNDDVGVRRPPPRRVAHAASIAPRASARVAARRAAGRSRAPARPSRSRAARPIEPPISPTPTTATFTRHARREHLARDRGRALDLLEVRRRSSSA